MTKDIKKIRDKIDSLDNEILELLNERAQQAVEISKEKEKSKSNDNFYNPEREAQVIRRIKELNKGPLSEDNIQRLYREIMSACLSLEGAAEGLLSWPRRNLYSISSKKSLRFINFSYALSISRRGFLPR